MGPFFVADRTDPRIAKSHSRPAKSIIYAAFRWCYPDTVQTDNPAPPGLPDDLKGVCHVSRELRTDLRPDRPGLPAVPRPPGRGRHGGPRRLSRRRMDPILEKGPRGALFHFGTCRSRAGADLCSNPGRVAASAAADIPSRRRSAPGRGDSPGNCVRLRCGQTTLRSRFNPSAAVFAARPGSGPMPARRRGLALLDGLPDGLDRGDRALIAAPNLGGIRLAVKPAVASRSASSTLRRERGASSASGDARGGVTDSQGRT